MPYHILSSVTNFSKCFFDIVFNMNWFIETLVIISVWKIDIIFTIWVTNCSFYTIHDGCFNGIVKWFFRELYGVFLPIKDVYFFTGNIHNFN